MKITRYRHPEHCYTVEVRPFRIWFYALLFGYVYFMLKKLWLHSLFCFLLGMLFLGFLNPLYAFFAPAILRRNYRKKGWIEIDDGHQNKNSPYTAVRSFLRDLFCYLFGVALISLLALLLAILYLLLQPPDDALHGGTQPPHCHPRFCDS